MFFDIFLWVFLNSQNGSFLILCAETVQYWTPVRGNPGAGRMPFWTQGSRKHDLKRQREQGERGQKSKEAGRQDPPNRASILLTDFKILKPQGISRSHPFNCRCITVGKRNYFTVQIPYFMTCKFCNSNTWTTVCGIFCTSLRWKCALFKTGEFCCVYYRTVKFLLHDWSWSMEEGFTIDLVKYGILYCPFIVITLDEQYSNYRKFMK